MVRMRVSFCFLYVTGQIPFSIVMNGSIKQVDIVAARLIDYSILDVEE